METLDHLLLGDVPPVDVLKIHVQGEGGSFVGSSLGMPVVVQLRLGTWDVDG